MLKFRINKRFVDMKLRLSRKVIYPIFFIICGLFSLNSCTEVEKLLEKECPECRGYGYISHTCQKCNGKGSIEILCRICSGKGRKTCDYCNGSGKSVCVGCEGWGTNYHTFYKTRHAACSKCNGSREMRCTICNGTGKQNCIFCEGKKKKCTLCNGGGIVYAFGNFTTCFSCDGQGYYTCSFCNGTNRIECSKYETCDLCNGTGGSNRMVTSKYTENETCPVCDGKGSIDCERCWRGTKKCYSCYGTGKMEEICDAYNCDNGNIKEKCQNCKGRGSKKIWE